MKRLAIAVSLLLATVAVAQLPANDRETVGSELIQILNGSPVFVAAVSTDGGIAANSCTSPAGASDAGKGDFVVIQCTQDHFIRTGTCSTAATTTSLKLAEGEKFYTMLRVDEMAISALPADAGVIGTCRVYHLK